MKYIEGIERLKKHSSMSMQHCKIMTLYDYLLLNNIEISHHLLYLLGADELMEFGLYKHKSTVLWFLNPYNYFCEQTIMDQLGIKSVLTEIPSFEVLCAMLNVGCHLTVAYDGKIYGEKREKEESIADRAMNDMTTTFVNNTSLGLIVGIDEQAKKLELNIVDIGGDRIQIDYDVFVDNGLTNHVYCLSLDKHSQQIELLVGNIEQICMERLVAISYKYLKAFSSYSMDTARGVYGTCGCSSLAALIMELKDQLKLLDNKDLHATVKNRLRQKLTILRLFFVKGSDTGFRKELSDALRHMEKTTEYYQLRKEADALKKAGRGWRDLCRYLFNVNGSFFERQPRKYINRLIGKIEKLYDREIAVFESLIITAKQY